nr:formyl transferase [Chthonobacter albigriseus]
MSTVSQTEVSKDPTRARTFVVRLPKAGGRAWHLTLLEALASNPKLHVGIDWAEETEAWPAEVDALFQLEATLFGIPRPGPLTRLPCAAFERYLAPPTSVVDVTIDFSLDSAEPASSRAWRLRFDGQEGPVALLGAVMAGHTPRVTLEASGQVIAAGRVGSERTGVVLATLEDMLERIVTMIAAAAKGIPTAAPPSLPDTSSETPIAAPITGKSVAVRSAKTIARAAVRMIYLAATRSPHWRTGWRRAEGGDLFDLRRHPDTGWADIPDDGRRFYADPFPIEHRGKLTLFVEDFPHRTGKGIISAVEFGPQGPVGIPRPVLELPVHLSYPFVFEAEGEMWMIPETSGAGTVELFRATRFPDGWTRESVLVSGVTASDATLVHHGGLWWIFATVRDGGGSFSDALHLWSAPDFRGPYTAHPRNPVLVDIASARPAGRIVERGGALFRPVQDCRKGYGVALGIARILKLDQDGFEQSVETILTAGPAWPGRRIHTLNAAGGLEFIDGSAIAPRWKRRRG